MSRPNKKSKAGQRTVIRFIDTITLIFPVVQKVIALSGGFSRREFQVQEHLRKGDERQQQFLARSYRMNADMFDSFDIGTSILHTIHHLIDFRVIGATGRNGSVSEGLTLEDILVWAEEIS